MPGGVYLLPMPQAPDLSKVRYEQDYRSGVVYHGGRDFDVFSSEEVGSALGGDGSYYWFTESFDNAKFYEDGAIHEGRLSTGLVAYADAADFEGMSARMIADEIFISRHEAGEEIPNAYVISGLRDGACKAIVIAVCVPHDESEASFERTRKHLWDDKRMGYRKVKTAGNAMAVEELA